MSCHCDVGWNVDDNKIKAWSANAQALALLSAMHDRRWTAYLTEPRDLTELATFTGLSADRLQDVVQALQANDIVELEGNRARLTAAYAGLMSPDAPFSMEDLLGEAELMSREVAGAIQGLSSAEGDALTLAAAYGPRPTAAAQALFSQLLDALPDIRDTLKTGWYLDVGCGVGGFLLSTASMFEGMRALGVELVSEVAAEASRRALAHGVADRVSIRCVDARDLDEEDTFDCAFWAQPFFASAARPATLAAILRALKPGAQLCVQEMERSPEDKAERGAFALRQLVFTGWDVPFARSAEDLTVEAESAGFLLDRVASTPLGRIVIVRKPDSP